MSVRRFSRHRLIELRRAARLTREELGSRVGRGRYAIDAWHTGRAVPPTSILPTLADALGVTIDELFSEE
jgi:XRE family transcriptional regulator, fatty acid utilization regulator